MEEDEDDLYGETSPAPTNEPTQNARPAEDPEDSDEGEDMDEDDSDSDIEIVTERPAGEEPLVLVHPNRVGHFHADKEQYISHR
jgi:hypothetical protein